MHRRLFLLALAATWLPGPAWSQSRRRDSERQRVEERAQERREERRDSEERGDERRARRRDEEERAHERQQERRDRLHATPPPPQTPTRPLDQPLPPQSSDQW